MKKILMLVSCVMFSSSVFAASALIGGGATGQITKIGKTTADGADLACDALSADTIVPAAQVKVGLSKENMGAIACSATDIGVAVASPKGKGKMFSHNSGGGAMTVGDCTGTPQVCDQTQTDTAADDALAIAGGSS